MANSRPDTELPDFGQAPQDISLGNYLNYVRSHDQAYPLPDRDEPLQGPRRLGRFGTPAGRAKKVGVFGAIGVLSAVLLTLIILVAVFALENGHLVPKNPTTTPFPTIPGSENSSAPLLGNADVQSCYAFLNDICHSTIDSFHDPLNMLDKCADTFNYFYCQLMPILPIGTDSAPGSANITICPLLQAFCVGETDPGLGGNTSTFSIELPTSLTSFSQPPDTISCILHPGFSCRPQQSTGSARTATTAPAGPPDFSSIQSAISSASSKAAKTTASSHGLQNSEKAAIATHTITPASSSTGVDTLTTITTMPRKFRGV